MIPKKLYIGKRYIDLLDRGTEMTRAWIANCPCTGRMEYTDLSQVWHSADEKPQVGKQVLGIDYDRDTGSGVFDYHSVYGVFICDHLVLDWDSVVRWAYIDDLLPKKK